MCTHIIIVNFLKIHVKLISLHQNIIQGRAEEYIIDGVKGMREQARSL